jgi:hypothetical protein
LLKRKESSAMMVLVPVPPLLIGSTPEIRALVSKAMGVLVALVILPVASTVKLATAVAVP